MLFYSHSDSILFLLYDFEFANEEIKTHLTQKKILGPNQAATLEYN